MQNTTQKISKDTLKRLREFGKMGETFDDVVNRLLDDTDEELEDVDEEDDTD